MHNHLSPTRVPEHAGVAGGDQRIVGNAHIRRKFIFLFLAAMCAIYVIVCVNTPRTILFDAAHDDALFMRLGRLLSEGEWLGPYNQMTLAKGPGFPLFLAVSHWLGMSYSLAVASFHCGAVAFFAWACWRLTRSEAVAIALFMLLLWIPVLFTAPMLRVFRDNIYSEQVLIFLGAAALALLTDRSSRSRWFHAALAGTSLGWLWLTREEGAWLLLGILALVAFATAVAWRRRRVQEVAAATGIATLAFFAIQLAFLALNHHAYGMFVGVDFKEGGYQSALASLHSVRSGGIAPYVSVTRAARQRIYSESPSFDSLKSFFEGEGGRLWQLASCRSHPTTCDGEIGVGFFVWALRDAAASHGHYRSPRAASDFFFAISREVRTACERGALQCVFQPVAVIPPSTWDQVKNIPTKMMDALRLAFVQPELDAQVWDGGQPLYMTALAFLNYPQHSGRSATEVVLRGWFYARGNEWFTIRLLQPDGAPAEVTTSRGPSPDIAFHFKDDAASAQRFTITAKCTRQCVVQLSSNSGAFQKTLGDLNLGLTELDSARFYIETLEWQGAPSMSNAQQVSRRIRGFVLNIYGLILMPILLIGVAAFAVASLAYRGLWLNSQTYGLALVAWSLVLSRAGILALMDVTTGAGVEVTYFLPASMLMPVAAVLSIAALVELRRRAKSRAVSECIFSTSDRAHPLRQDALGHLD